MKKRVQRLIIVIIVLILVTLTACSKLINGRYDPSLSIGEQIKTRHYDHSAVVFGKGELLDEILDASEKKDVDRIFALFSDYAIEENDELYSEIEFYLDNFPEIDELFNRGCSEFGSHNRGSTEYNYLYEPVVHIIDISGNKYRLVVMWIEGDSENPDKQGIHSIQLISEEAYNNHDYTIHSQDDRPGVYVYI